MQRFLKWLGNLLFPSRSEPALRQTNAPLRVVRPAARPAATRRPPAATETAPDPSPANEPELIDFEAGLDGRIEEVGPGKNVLVRNKYLREDTGTHETLKIIDDTAGDSVDEDGFDPYNTGRFDRSKKWKRR